MPCTAARPDDQNNVENATASSRAIGSTSDRGRRAATQLIVAADNASTCTRVPAKPVGPGSLKCHT
jgi:hypothetical protein